MVEKVVSSACKVFFEKAGKRSQRCGFLKVYQLAYSNRIR